MLIYDAPFNPPQALRVGGYVILLEFVILIGGSYQTSISQTLLQMIVLAINPIACLLVGLAAKQLGKSWLLYGLLPAALLVPPGSLFSYYKLRTAARYQWLDSHAIYVKDGV